MKNLFSAKLTYMDCAGFIFDDSRHYLDHLAPFCSLMKWPLIILDPEVAALARKYYPDLSVQETAELPPAVVSCDSLPLLQASGYFPKTLFWLPHGHSDKGWKIPIFEALTTEIPLVYGQTMFHHLKHKRPIRIGNFRHYYFTKHRAFYQTLVPRGPFFLYAPTWEDPENNSSFFYTLPSLNLSPLLVKIHPNTQRKYAAELEALIGKYPNIHFLLDFPPIYPLLERALAYIGDMSSIGYDFLHYNRPMFFFPAQTLDLPLFRCGQIGFHPSDQWELTPVRKELYIQTFDPIDSWEPIAQEILSRL